MWAEPGHLLEPGARRATSARLSHLAYSHYRTVRETIAADPRAFPETLELPAFDDEPEVRKALLLNPKGRGPPG